ncbi:MAG TPA: serine/threonine-protein kinase [Pirellulales bacterium]|nr:serine/threonine-protein kinase [Pirellulales bacterium]
MVGASNIILLVESGHSPLKLAGIVESNSKTLQAVTRDAPLDDSYVLGAEFQRVGIIEGSRPELTAETTDILRTRLRAAAGLLGLGFGLFFVYRLINGDSEIYAVSESFWCHFGVVLVLIASYFLLCRRCQIPITVLRGYELAIFGLPVGYFLISQYEMFLWASRRGFCPNPTGFWMGLVFIYAMFIPNTWRRAAVITGAMCVAPLLLVGYLWATNDNVAMLFRSNSGFVVEITIMMSVTFLCATYGTHMIGHLRREAFEAKQLGQYRLCRQLGSGGMGEVYLAEHQMMKRPCAIKLIRPGKAADPQALARFEREVRATARLSHWNTVEIFDYGRTEDGTFYYVMEYLPGLSLAELIDKHGPLPPARAIHLLMQTCDALAEAHKQGLIHRDIKPGNIFSAQRGGVYDVAKLLDFGLAKPIAADSSVHLTQEGAITGSPLYMSPEQALGDSEPDARSDIYSLGAVAYYLLTGAPPFEGERAIRIILAHAHESVVPPSRLRADIPADLEQVVLRCLAKNPGDRFQDVLALRQALAECAAAGSWNHGDAARWWQQNGEDPARSPVMATI